MNLELKTLRHIYLRQSLLLGVALTSPLWFASPQVLAIGINITSINTTTTTGTATTDTAPGSGVTDFPTGTSYTLNFAGDTTRINSFTTSQTSGTVLPSTPNIFIRTNPNTNQKQNVWYQGTRTGNTFNLRSNGPLSQAQALGSNNVLVGGDSIFTNVTSNISSAEERVDFVLQSPILARDTLGFTIFDRGAGTSHDAFKIAAITGISGTTPTTYSTLNLIPDGWGTTSLLTSNVSQIVLNNANNNPVNTGVPRNPTAIRSGSPTTTASPNQNIGGIFIGTNELAPVGTQIFGYSLFATDVTTGCGNLSDWTNTGCYPTTTSGSLDPVGANLGAVSYAVPEPLTIVGSAMALGFGALMKLQDSRKRKKTKQVG